jgi:hypothetical protein
VREKVAGSSGRFDHRSLVVCRALAWNLSSALGLSAFG